MASVAGTILSHTQITSLMYALFMNHLLLYGDNIVIILYGFVGKYIPQVERNIFSVRHTYATGLGRICQCSSIYVACMLLERILALIV